MAPPWLLLGWAWGGQGHCPPPPRPWEQKQGGQAGTCRPHTGSERHIPNGSLAESAHRPHAAQAPGGSRSSGGGGSWGTQALPRVAGQRRLGHEAFLQRMRHS